MSKTKTTKTTAARPASNTAAPAAASPAAGRETFLASVLAAYGSKARTIEEVAKAVKAEERAVRGALDGARRRGWKVKRTAACTFQLTPPKAA